MRRVVLAIAVLIALSLTVTPFAAAGPEKPTSSEETIDKLIRELEGLMDDVDKVLERVRRMRNGESGPSAGRAKPRPTPLTRQKAQELQNMMYRATELIQSGKYEEAIPVYRELVSEMEKYGIAGQALAVNYYNLACCLALTGETDEAFDALLESLENGYVDFDHITQDPDLKSLHGDERWKKMLSRKDEYIEKAKRGATQRPDAGRGMPGRGANNETLRRLQTLAGKAMELLQDRKLDEAIEAYLELISEVEKAGITSAGLAVHYYNLACAYSLSGKIDEAFETLLKSVENGYVDFAHIEHDSDLNNLHDDGRWKDLFAKKDEYIEKAQDKILDSYTKRFDAEDYLKDFDKEHSIVYMTNLGKGTLEAMKSQLNEYADLQWKTLFTYRFSRPLAILCLAREDFRKLVPSPGVGGFYQPANHVLVVPELSFTLVHEFTHALHNADQQGRHQTHPLWLTEGLATLFETSIVEKNEIKCLHNPRLEVLRSAIQNKQIPDWKKFMVSNPRTFMSNSRLNYAYTRYFFYWLWEQGLLRSWYESYCGGYKHDKTGVRATEYVMNMKIEEAQKKWEEWVLAKPTAPGDMSVGRAFFGVATEETDEGLKVIRVVEGTGADKAGLKVDDIILEFEGEKIESREVFMKSIQARRVGDKITVKVMREDEELVLEICLTGRPATVAQARPRSGTARRPGRDDRTLRRRPTEPGGTTRINPRGMEPTIGVRTRDTEDGVEVRSVYRNSTGAIAGLKAGDIIVEFNGEEVTSGEQLNTLLQACRPGQKVAITIERNGEAIEFEVSIGVRIIPSSGRGRTPAPGERSDEPGVRRGAKKK